MKINSKVLSDFLNKATLNAKIESSVLYFNDAGLDVFIKNGSNAVFCKSFLDKKNFKDYEVITVAIKDNNKLLKIIKEFDSDIEIKKDGNVVSFFNANKQVNFILAEEQFIDNNIKREVLPQIEEGLLKSFDAGFDLQSEYLRKVVRDMNILESFNVVIEVKNKVLNLTIGEDNFDKITETVSINYKDVKAKYGEFLTSVVSVIGDNVVISLGDSKPIQIEEKLSCGGYVKYIVAPLIENTE